MTFLWALLVSFFGAFSIVITERESKYGLQYVIRFTVYLLLMWFIQYNALIVFDAYRTITTILILFTISNIWNLVAKYDYPSEIRVSETIGASLSVLILLGFGFSSCDCMRAKELHEVVEKQRIDATLFNSNPVDENHIRVVPKETALRVARQMISEGGRNYGAFFVFNEDTMGIQKVNNRLYWVAPMEFGSYFKESKVKSSPGFIIISAENETEEPRLVTQKADKTPIAMKYLVSGWFSTNLERYLYNKYPTLYLQDYSLEVDEELRPWQVVTVLDRFAGYDYYTVKGVIIVNPETGKDKYYDLKDVPAWVDRVVPEELAGQYFKWWGRYKEGWVINNTFDPREDLKQPTDVGNIGTAWMVYGADGEPYWFSGFTSLTVKDQALIGKGFINTRTGKFVYVDKGVKGATEERAISDITAAFQKMNVEIKVTAPIPYNLYGRPNCWVVPVISASSKEGNQQSHSGGKLIKIAILDGETTSPPILADSKNEALLLFRRVLAGQGLEVAVSDQSTLTEVTGPISRMSLVNIRGETVIRFSVAGSSKEFSCDLFTSDKQPTSLSLAAAGDQIALTYQETQERVVTVTKFTILGQAPIISPNQERMDEMVRQQRETEAGWDKAAAPAPVTAPMPAPAAPSLNP